ncbi:hypothetical protein [Shewanella algae]|uniref:hypothetical protein n=1 Tax=Shewanella algae TaxID=38313 RepID=UPI001AAE3945|nr:hypothetical protein [Shewanella algae]MBO2590995.1 hypothetical protein [Shewanella algae]MBO2591004.1 hypothetical protein [Shewanella algae]
MDSRDDFDAYTAMCVDSIEVGYCLCQDCLLVYRYTIARHNDEEVCCCGGQLCGCLECDIEASRLVYSGQKVAID